MQTNIKCNFWLHLRTYRRYVLLNATKNKIINTSYNYYCNLILLYDNILLGILKCNKYNLRIILCNV